MRLLNHCKVFEEGQLHQFLEAGESLRMVGAIF
jgi:hypothetical protein